MRGALMASAFAFSMALTAEAQSPSPATIPTPDHHAHPPEDVFKVKPLGGGAYALFGRGGNIGFFVGPDSVIVVDSQFVKDVDLPVYKAFRGYPSRFRDNAAAYDESR